MGLVSSFFPVLVESGLGGDTKVTGAYLYLLAR
jgi:hypothetical protein